MAWPCAGVTITEEYVVAVVRVHSIFLFPKDMNMAAVVHLEAFIIILQISSAS